MKWQLIVAGARTAVFGMLFLAGTASAELRIMNDPGGEVSSYHDAFGRPGRSASELTHVLRDHVLFGGLRSVNHVDLDQLLKVTAPIKLALVLDPESPGPNLSPHPPNPRGWGHYFPDQIWRTVGGKC
jgi:hypothetical protein